MKYDYILLVVFLVASLIFVFVFRSMHNGFADKIERENCEIDTSVCYNNNIVLALEFACNAETVGRIFDKCEEDKEVYLKRVTYIDFGFLLAYTLTAIWFARLLFVRDKTWKQSVIGMAVIVGLADVFENMHMLWIMQDLTATADIDQYTWWLSLFTWVKWLLAIALVVIIVIKLFRVAWHRFFRHNL